MGRPKGSKNKPKPITADDLARNCADCPKPIERKCDEKFTSLECATMTAVGILLYAVFVSDWLASL